MTQPCPQSRPALRQDATDPPCETSGGRATVTCPICGGKGVERKQKWFCGKCGQLLATCCD